VGALALCLLLLAQAAAAKCLRYEPSLVTLSGTIFSRVDFGPPNYGEYPKTDSHEKHLYLKLDRTICVAANKAANDLDDQPERNISTIEMSFLPPLLDKTWIGKHVAVSGTLFHAFSGHHWTPVLINVKQARLSPEKEI
jgi:hypothetical protein